MSLGRTIIAFIGTLLIAGCFGPVRPPMKTQYTLNLKNFRNPHTHSPITILVAKPTASPGYGSRRMVYNRRPYEIKTYADNEWAGSPADLLQPVIIQSLRDTGRFRAVVAPPLPARRDYLLKTNLVELRQDFTYRPSCLKMALQAELINNKSRRVIASRIFAIQIPTISNDAYGGVLAANRATTLILWNLRRFCIRHLLYGGRVQLPKPGRWLFLPSPLNYQVS